MYLLRYSVGGGELVMTVIFELWLQQWRFGWQREVEETEGANE